MRGSFAVTTTGSDWRQALDQALAGFERNVPGLAFLFASYHYAEAYGDIVEHVGRLLGPEILLGCSGQGDIGTGREIEDEAAISLMALDLPGADLTVVRLNQRDFASTHGPAGWIRRMGIEPPAVNAWVVLADPFTFDVSALIDALGLAYPGVPVLGGMASAQPGQRGTRLYSGNEVLSEGALVLAVGGGWTVHAVVSQGAEPIGQAWTVTAAEGNVIKTIAGRPALEVLVETIGKVPPAARERVSQNLLVGLAMDEYRDEFKRGDFLISNFMGADRATGAIGVGAEVRVGQTVQFQFRDAAAADDELRVMLAGAHETLGSTAAGALLCSCNGRGAGLFGAPDHDATAVAGRFGQLPVAGLFCNGEIGPVGGKNFVHGFTASIAFFVPTHA